MPADLYNGMALTLLKNLPARATAAAHMVAFMPKPRLVKMGLAQEGTDSARVGGATRKATRIPREAGGGRPPAWSRHSSARSRRSSLLADSRRGPRLREVRGRDVPEGADLAHRADPDRVGALTRADSDDYPPSEIRQYAGRTAKWSGPTLALLALAAHRYAMRTDEKPLRRAPKLCGPSSITMALPAAFRGRGHERIRT